MSTYDMEPSPAPEKQPDSKKIAFRFCRECSNMLYPKEDRMNSTLMFACRTCQFSEPATASCIYRNSLKEDVAENPGNTEDVAQDPTVRANSTSSMRLRSDADLSDDDMEDVLSTAEFVDLDAAMEMYAYWAPEDVNDAGSPPDLCTLCGEEILCPLCKRPSDGGVALEVEDPACDVTVHGDKLVEAEMMERSLSGRVNGL